MENLMLMLGLKSSIIKFSQLVSEIESSKENLYAYIRARGLMHHPILSTSTIKR